MKPPVQSRRYLACLFLIILLFRCAEADSQTTLTTGDIAFTGYNSNNAGVAYNNFSFVIVRPGGIAANTVINFTDCGYNSVTASLQSSAGDGIISWRATTDMPQSAEVSLKVTAAGTAMETVSAGIVDGISGSFVLSPTGDQVIAYQGTFASPVFVAGIHMNFEPLTGTSPRSDSSNWDNLRASGGLSFNENRSAIPPGGSWCFFGPVYPAYTEYDNARMKCPVDSMASRDALNDYLFFNGNWNQTDITPYTLPVGCNILFKKNPTISSVTNKVICPGANTMFGLNAVNASAYQWQVNDGTGFLNLSVGGVYSGVTTRQLTLTAVPATMNGYQYRCIVVSELDNAVTILSNTATLTTNVQTWQGNTSSDWTNAANWTCGAVPTSINNITIPSGRPNQPTIPAGTVSVNNITLNPGAILTLASGATLDIKGDFVRNGTFNANGTVIFSGTNQAIPAGTFTNLTINGGGTKTIAGNILINGVLTLTNGFLQLNNNSLSIGNSGSISGGSNISFVLTNGTGTLNRGNIGASGIPSAVFPVGSAVSSYTPVVVANLGTSDQFLVRVFNGISTAYDAGGFAVGDPLTSFNVNKTWLVSEAIPGGSNATLTFQWSAGDEQPGFNRNDVYAGHYTGGQWVTGPLNQMSSGTDPYTLSLTGITSFSPFGIGSQGSLLPLQLLTFSAKLADDASLLEWTTAGERSLQKFIIERSNDGIVFAAIGELAAVNQPGNYSYSFRDYTVSDNRYYRLKCVDLDGRYTFSPIILLAGSANSSLSFYPNPATETGTLRIQLKRTTKINFSMINASGDVIKKWEKTLQKGISSELVKMGKLPSGFYYLVLDAEEVNTKIRIIKQ